MSRIPVFVGLDYYQHSVQVCVMEASGRVLGNRGCDGDIGRLVAYVHGIGAVRGVAIECCEGAACFAEALIAQAGWSVHPAHPGYVSRMRQNPDKTDYSDAGLLADLERVGYVPRVWMAPPSIRELRRLVRYRGQLVNTRRQVKLRAEVGRFDRFRSGKQLARCCGLTPRNASSGARQADAGLIHACNHALRSVLIEAAHRVMRYERRSAAPVPATRAPPPCEAPAGGLRRVRSDELLPSGPFSPARRSRRPHRWNVNEQERNRPLTSNGLS